MLAMWTGVGTAQRIMEADDAAAALDERIERGPLLIRHVASIALVHDHHVNALELGGRGEVERAVNHGAAVGQHLAPIGEVLRVVVQHQDHATSSRRGCRP